MTKNIPKISIICCIAKNRGIGKNNKLLFDLPEDLRHFKEITVGHPVIMGLNTYNSIGRPLPKRTNIVLSLDPVEIPEVIVAGNIDQAIRIAQKNDKKEIFFIGGGMIYRQAIKLADRLYLTVVDAEPEADTFFPEYKEFNKAISEESHSNNEYNFKYLILEKV
jgi:dihydrofolate reductase